MNRAARLPWIAFTLIVAALVHLGSLYLLPRVVMARVLDKMGAANTLHVGHRPDASSRGVVRPSPDLLYASCPFDLSKGPLRVAAIVPKGAYYWSVSAFDSSTNNFFVRNDKQITGNSFEVTLIRHGQALPPLGNAVESAIVFAPSDKGLILLRTVVDDEQHAAALEAALRQSSCQTVASAKRLG